jgi:hypothetical protein
MSDILNSIEYKNKINIFEMGFLPCFERAMLCLLDGEKKYSGISCFLSYEMQQFETNIFRKTLERNFDMYNRFICELYPNDIFESATLYIAFTIPKEYSDKEQQVYIPLKTVDTIGKNGEFSFFDNPFFVPAYCSFVVEVKYKKSAVITDRNISIEGILISEPERSNIYSKNSGLFFGESYDLVYQSINNFKNKDGII